MICHGCASRCMISDSANGSNCGVCNEGTLSAAPTDPIWDSENTRIWPGIRLPSVSSASRARSTPPIDNKSSTTLGGPSTGERPMPVVARDRCGDLDDRVGCGELELAGGAFEAGIATALPDLGERGFECARRIRRPVAAQPLPDRQQRSTPDLAGPHRKVAFDQKRLQRTEQQPGRIVGPRTRLVVFLGAAHDLAELLEHEIGDGYVLPALNGALELPHQQRLRLGRELRRGESLSRSVDVWLIRLVWICVCQTDGKAPPPPILEVCALRSRLGITKSTLGIAGVLRAQPQVIGGRGVQTPGSTNSARNPLIGASPRTRLPP